MDKKTATYIKKHGRVMAIEKGVYQLHDDLELKLNNKNKNQIARKCKVARQTVYHWIDGTKEPTIPSLIAIAQYLCGDEWEEQYMAWSKMINTKHLNKK